MLGAKEFRRVKYSSFIIETQPIISKTEDSATEIIIVLLRNMVALPREMSKRVESSCPWKQDLR